MEKLIIAVRLCVACIAIASMISCNNHSVSNNETRQVSEKEPAILIPSKVSAMEGHDWIWLYVEDNEVVYVFTIPFNSNKLTENSVTVGFEDKDSAVKLSGPDIKTHAYPKPPLHYHFRNTIPKNEEYEIIQATKGELTVSLAKNESVRFEIERVEYSDNSAISIKPITVKVGSIPP